jgi:hypothetical protein
MTDAPWDQETDPAIQPRELQVIDGGKLKKATSKEEVFIQAVLKGATYSEAYRQGYSVGAMSDATLWSEASRVAGRPHVSARLQAGWAKREERAVHSARSLQTRILQGLLREAEEAESDSARVAAWAHLGKYSGLGSEQEEDNPAENMTPDEVLDTIRERLEKAFNK